MYYPECYKTMYLGHSSKLTLKNLSMILVIYLFFYSLLKLDRLHANFTMGNNLCVLAQRNVYFFQ